ncbi:MAG: response regulator, partial [Bacteroidota bacterium]
MKNNLSSESEQDFHEILPVWIVEDDQKTGSTIERSLNNNGFECRLFHSGKNFLNFLKQNNPDSNSAIMLLDFLLEDTNAINLIQTIESMGYSNPFVIMTAFGDEKTAVDLMKLGAMDYVVKEKLFINQIQKIIVQVSEKVSIRKKLERSQEELKRSAEKLKNLNEQINQQKLAIENEKKNTDKLLQSILPKKIADELLQQGYTKPRQYKNVSILFADVIGFSDLTKQSHPIDLVSRLDNYFYVFDEIIEYYGLEKIKT